MPALFRDPSAARAGGIVLGGRGIGSATGLYFLEPLIFANVPAFLWLGYVGAHIARLARADRG